MKAPDFLPLVVAVAAAVPAAVQALPQKLPTFSIREANSAGPGHPWFNGPYLPALHPGPGFINSFALGLQTEAPLVALRTPGGVTVRVALHHNSQAPYSNPALGDKWSHSLAVFLLPYYEQDNVPRMGVYWGNHREQRFKLESNRWVPLDGYRDVLQTTPTSATLTLHDQTRLEFFAGYVAGKPAYKLDRIVDTSGNTIEINHDALGRVASAADPFGRTLTLTYSGRRLTQVRYAYQTWSRTWNLVYANKRLAEIVYPPVTSDAGVQTYTTSFAYDARGNIVGTTDAEGHTWLYGYHSAPASDRLRWVQPPGNTPAQRYLYTWVDPLTRRLTDPRGVSVDLEFDPQVRLARFLYTGEGFWLRSYGDPDYSWAPSSVVAPSGTTLQNDYDSRGNVVGAVDSAGHRTDHTYDDFNHLTRTLQPLVTDAWGSTEPVRRQTDFAYDASHRLIAVSRLAEPEGTVHVWSLAYSALGQITQATDPLGRTMTYTHDALGNLTRVTSPAGRTFDWLYTEPEGTFGFTLPDGLVNGLGQTTSLARDEWGRLRVKDYPTSPDERYSHDGLSRLVRAEDAAVGPTVYTYTPAGLLASQQRGPQLIQINRLANGLPAAVVESGLPMPRLLQYQYGPRNELVTLTDGGAAVTFAYDEDLRPTTRGLPNGASAAYAYFDGRLASIVHKDAGQLPFAAFSYTYQANGQRMQVTELDGSVVRYGYDLLDRMVREERTGAVPYAFQWTFDAAGNRLVQIQGNQVTQYAYDPDNLLTQMNSPLGVWTYDWDDAGRLVQRIQPMSVDFFQYSDGGGLLHVDHAEPGFPALPWRDYAYTAFGNRAMRMAFGSSGQPQTQEGFFDLATVPFREERFSFQGGEPSSFRPTFAGGLVRWLDAIASVCMYPATDADGSVRAWTDNSGAVGPHAAVYNRLGQAILDQGPRPPYAFNADAGTRNDGDFGWLVIRDRALYSPLEGLTIGAGHQGGEYDNAFWKAIPLTFDHHDFADEVVAHEWGPSVERRYGMFGGQRTMPTWGPTTRLGLLNTIVARKVFIQTLLRYLNLPGFGTSLHPSEPNELLTMTSPAPPAFVSVSDAGEGQGTVRIGPGW